MAGQKPIVGALTWQHSKVRLKLLEGYREAARGLCLCLQQAPASDEEMALLRAIGAAHDEILIWGRAIDEAAELPAKVRGKFWQAEQAALADLGTLNQMRDLVEANRVDVYRHSKQRSDWKDRGPNNGGI